MVTFLGACFGSYIWILEMFSAEYMHAGEIEVVPVEY